MHREEYSDPALLRGKISVVIPVWRENAALSRTITFLWSEPSVKEVILSFADGEPASIRKMEQHGAVCIDAGHPNRGRQLDLGAQRAGGDWLLFHHLDTLITPAHLLSLASIPPQSPVLGGAFYRKFDERHPHLRWLEPIERWHNRSFGALYGDQSIFVRRQTFHDLGGFRGLPLMEDVDFSLRLRRAGPVQLLDPPIQSSPRKHHAQGAWRTTFRNALLLMRYHLGTPPGQLHASYYRNGASGEGNQPH